MFNLWLAAAPVVNTATKNIPLVNTAVPVVNAATQAAPVVNAATKAAAPVVNAATQAAPAVNAAAHAAGNLGGNIFHYLLLGVYLLICIGLIIAVLVQTTKSEGLSGVIGGATQSIFRGTKSIEQKLNQFTTYLAVAFIVLSIAISFWGFK